jgi:hypothetical protein
LLVLKLNDAGEDDAALDAAGFEAKENDGAAAPPVAAALDAAGFEAKENDGAAAAPLLAAAGRPNDIPAAATLC